EITPIPSGKDCKTLSPNQPTVPPASRVYPVLMPQVGQSMEQGTIIKWRVRPGERVNKGDILFEVETDKAVIEVEATEAGRLARIIVPEGETVQIKQPVAYLADNDKDLDAFLAVRGKSSAELASDPNPVAEPERGPEFVSQSGPPP